MTVSIAMTTYNGSLYVIQQLESINNQSQKPDEVIICDDNSTDNTIELVQRFINNNKLNNWYLYQNSKNLGWIKNFYSALERTSGDIVLFSDQDDIWDTKKIETMYNCFTKYDNIEVLGCKVKLLDSYGKALSKGSYSGKLVKSLLNNHFIYSITPGCTMAVRRNMINNLKEIEKEGIIPHDALFWKFGTLLGNAYIIDLPLVGYRIHDKNASNPSASLKHKISSRKSRIGQVNTTKSQLLIILNYWKIYFIQESNYHIVIQLINDLIVFCDSRINYISQTKCNLIHYLNINYKYYACCKMFIGDLLAKHMIGENR